MLKAVFVLGCLLCIALANPIEKAPKRLARSDSFSNEVSAFPYPVIKNDYPLKMRITNMYVIINVFHVLAAILLQLCCCITPVSAVSAVSTVAPFS
uniref:Uncharacterized protein n=1 Tax=Mastacembelus armatus TaxID=205130 RepID=A0A3Q3MX22_9TELE